MSARLALSIALTAAGTLILATIACAGSGSASLDDYFRQLSEADDRFDESSTDAEGQEYQSVQKFMLQVFIPLYTDYLADIRELRPPFAVEAAHQELVDATANMLALLEDSEPRYASLQSQVELGEFFDEPDVAAANDRTIQACSALQQLAYANDVSADLGC